jgi:hypothetical protein
VYSLRKSHSALKDRRRSKDGSNNFTERHRSSANREYRLRLLEKSRHDEQSVLAHSLLFVQQVVVLEDSIDKQENGRDVMGAACVARSVEANPTPEAAAQVQPYLRGGFLWSHKLHRGRICGQLEEGSAAMGEAVG